MDDLAFQLARLALLLEHFSKLSDDREPERIMYPIGEVLLLLTCATICAYDDCGEIAAWGRHHLPFPRRFSVPFRPPLRALAAQPRQPH